MSAAVKCLERKYRTLIIHSSSSFVVNAIMTVTIPLREFSRHSQAGVIHKRCFAFCLACSSRRIDVAWK